MWKFLYLRTELHASGGSAAWPQTTTERRHLGSSVEGDSTSVQVTRGVCEVRGKRGQGRGETQLASGGDKMSHSKNVALSYEGACHRCGLPGHIAKNCPKPRICAKCGMAGHIEKFCGQKQLTSKEKMLAKYSEVCHRCGNKGHTSRECPRNTISCRVCGEDHRPGECPMEDNTLESMIRTKKEETSEFAKRRLRAEMAEKERRMAAAKGSGSAGFGTGVEEKGSSGVGLIGNTRQPVIQVKRRENPQFLVVSKEKANKRVAGGSDAGKPGEGERNAKRAKAEGEDDSSEEEEGLGGLLGDYDSDDE